MNNCWIVSRCMSVLLQFVIWITLYRKECEGYSTIKVVLDKQDVEFSCPMPHIDATCIWKYEDRILFNGYEVFKEQFPKFDVKINRTHCNLMANNVRMNVAGSYVCETISSFNKREVFSYELIMLDSNPVCSMLPHNILFEGETLRMQCKIIFRGHLTPVMKFAEVGTGEILKDYVSRQFIPPNQKVTLTVVRNVSSSDNGSMFVCNIIFTNTSSPTNITNNTPGYKYTWHSSVVNVYYYPRIVNVSPKKMYYQLDDVIECSADGNPKPTYSWKSVDSGFVIDGPNLVVTYNMTWNNGYKYICSASTESFERNITWIIDSDVLFIHMSNQDDQFDHKSTIRLSLTFGIILIAICAAFMSYIIYNKKKYERHVIVELSPNRAEVEMPVSESLSVSSSSHTYTAIRESAMVSDPASSFTADYDGLESNAGTVQPGPYDRIQRGINHEAACYESKHVYMNVVNTCAIMQ